MSQPNSPHFHRGKEARAAGRICLNTDRRLSPKSREEWYAGWNFQDAHMRPTPTKAERESSAAFLRNLSAEVRASL